MTELAWRAAALRPRRVVPFERSVYAAVLDAFADRI